MCKVSVHFRASVKSLDRLTWNYPHAKIVVSGGWVLEEEERMQANRRQSLAELCNPKLVMLAQVPHRTAHREDPKLARRKWQPPHNMGEPQTE